MRGRAIGTGVIAAGIAVVGVVVTLAGRGDSSAPAASEARAGEDVGKNALSPAAHLRIHLKNSAARPEALLDPSAAEWTEAKPTALLLSRTPRIYRTEPALDRPVPRCQVKALRMNGKAYLRLEWDDATKDAPEAPPAKKGSGATDRVLYKRPTGETSAFADAAAVMVPQDWKGPAFPSLLMGDAHAPATLYYWNAARGAEVLTASGRATPKPVGKSFPARARHDAGKWVLTLEIPEPASGYPVAFALWDGAAGDRDGLKFFSVWYVFTHE